MNENGEKNQGEEFSKDEQAISNNSEEQTNANDTVTPIGDVKVETVVSSVSVGKEVLDWVLTIVLAVVITFGIKAFLFDVVKVDGSSMFPTLVNEDRLVVTKLGYKPHNGDIIILDSTCFAREQYISEKEKIDGKAMNIFQKFMLRYTGPSNLRPKYYVKRVIATEGQTINLVNGRVIVDNKILDEAYYKGKTYPMNNIVNYPVTVKKDFVFVMGDNRPNSQDSRSSQLGQVPYEAVLGKAVFRLFPFSSFGSVK